MMKKVFLVLVLIGLVFTGFSKNIVEVAVSAGNFTTLVAAVEKAGLVETLIGDGPFTVFAPTDEAFAKLPEGTVESLQRYTGTYKNSYISCGSWKVHVFRRGLS